MQSKNSKIQTRPIEDLIGRIRTLRQKGERQIIIPAKEADQLADSLTQVMTRMVTIQEEIIESMVDEHNWLINRVPDDYEMFSAFYIQADDMANYLKIDR